ncbi:MAG: hypothetical protein E7261_08540 [Lachnospiraceae bacterium]|nr:hypothetical protein [Lachnospiraceae bacterium]
MKLSKRIFAIIGIVLLIALFITTLVLAFVDPTADKSYFKAALFLCVVVPIMIYAYILTYRHMRDKKQKED